MRLDFAFGKTGLPLDLPDEYAYQVLEARSAAPLPNPAEAIQSALDAPAFGPSLSSLASGKRSAAISVCDITRPAPNKAVLPHVLARLEKAGIAPRAITILIATGLHRPATNSEIREILGEEISTRYPVVNHNARELSEHESLGSTSSGIPVYIDKRFLAADLHITLGFIEPHLMLGFSGGRKLIAPGLAAQETIKVIHSPKFMRDPRAVEGSIESNPLHRELLEIARMARHDFLLDVALTRRREIAGVFAGPPELAHAEGVSFVSRVMLEQLDAPADAVITSSAGYPLDLTFYQAVKGITAAQHVVKPGGRILLVAECSEGAGAPEFREMLKRCRSCGEFLDLIANGPVIVDQWQLEKLALAAQRASLLFYAPGLPSEFHEALWGTPFDSPQHAVRALFDGLPPGARVALMPEGPYVLAKTRAMEEVFA
jgi:nickel-dependent lactate racemase